MMTWRAKTEEIRWTVAEKSPAGCLQLRRTSRPHVHRVSAYRMFRCFAKQAKHKFMFRRQNCFVNENIPRAHLLMQSCRKHENKHISNSTCHRRLIGERLQWLNGIDLLSTKQFGETVLAPAQCYQTSNSNASASKKILPYSVFGPIETHLRRQNSLRKSGTGRSSFAET